MLTTQNNNTTKIDFNDVKLTLEELRQFSDFANTDEQELLEIRETIYQLSIILYKSSNE